MADPTGADDLMIPHSLLRAFAAGDIALWLPRDAGCNPLRYITIARDGDGVVLEWQQRDALHFVQERYESLAAAVETLAVQGWVYEGWEPTRRRFDAR